MTNDNPTQNRPTLNVTSLSQYVRLENCDRFLRLRLRRDEEKALLKRWNLTIQPLTPLLKEAGFEFERQVGDAIAAGGEQVVDLEAKTDTGPTLDYLRQARQPVILLQPWIQAQLGRYPYRGRADAVRLHRTRQGKLHAFIADVKASRHPRMEHRLQVATYAHLLRSMATRAGTPIAGIEGAVLHIQEDGTIPALDRDTPTFDLDTYTDILHHLAVTDDCVVNRIADLPFEEVPYHLAYKCDGCMYNAICMYDSAQRLDLSLTPYISAVEKRVLNAAGISTLPDLANLMTLPDRDAGERELTVTPGQEAPCQALTNQWPVGPNLPLLVQRARRALRRFDADIPSTPFIYGAGYGTLPSDDDHPRLVKVFFDAQHDYLQDRVYMISALVTGPFGAQPIVHSTDAPPTEQSERDLLIAWVLDVIAAMQQVAEADTAPIHLYCYNRYDQKVLLEALKRHLEQVAALPIFFDLMTQSPALSQPIISFLSSELEERVNLGLTCNPLHDAARMRGFDWSDDQHEYYRLFRARLFDNRRNVIRHPDGPFTRVDQDTPKDAPGRLTIEAASRFNSQIPLEYAYGAWGRLPQAKENKRLLDQFRQVTLDELHAFATHRARALAHLEASFKYKARWIPKQDIDLSGLIRSQTTTSSLARSLEEFLFMEHHASLQAKLLNYSLPIDRRAQTGLALLLRHQGPRPGHDDVHHFAIEFDAIGLDPVLTMNASRLKEGDWVVINKVDPQLTAGRIKGGRLAIIQQLGPDDMTLELIGATFYHSKFRYPHDNQLEPEPGEFYTLDEMADDLNADKALAALHNADTNALYQWLLHKPADRPVDPRIRSMLAQLAQLIDTVEPKAKLTSPQRDVVTQRLADPLFLVQGPPGTGKSHTLAWAVLARLGAAAAQGRPFRVAVSCKTHNSTNIVLAAIADKLRKLTAFPTPLTKTLSTLQVHKIVNDNADHVPEGVTRLKAYRFGAGRLESLLARSPIVIGGTPGGLFNIMKYRAAGGNDIDWNLNTFDLVVIDEASQMSLPEGILASAFLKPEGSIIVVGDHRQMPPIIAHDWEDEEKRTITAARPYLSLFESLIERDFPWVALDQSFRLHKTIAKFLQDNIYVRDGIHFFSKRTDILDQPPLAGEYVNKALDPNYPIVVIEHGEQRSQQYNETEITLVTPLIRICAEKLRLDGMDGIGVVVPHRAQRALLREHFPDLAVTDSIDTVERFQGGERDVIIVSATASDPDYVLAEASFLLNLNRLNVALSRPRKKLIVVASRSVIDLLVSDLDIFDNAVIWKRLYYQYAADLLWEGRLGDIPIYLRGTPAA